MNSSVGFSFSSSKRECPILRSIEKHLRGFVYHQKLSLFVIPVKWPMEKLLRFFQYLRNFSFHLRRILFGQYKVLIASSSASTCSSNFGPFSIADDTFRQLRSQFVKGGGINPYISVAALCVPTPHNEIYLLTVAEGEEECYQQ